jgi:hypothetical protein
MTDIIKDAVNAIGGLLTKHHKELLTKFDVPTPQKITANLQADATGVIGGGFANPSPVTIWQCPMSQEAAVHRIAITSPSGTPKTPLTTGQVMLVGGSGELILFLPVGGTIAPMLATEGYGSAAHLNSGSRISAYADGLPANCQLRIDLQVSFTIGRSQFTPTNHSSESVYILE